MWLVVTAAQYRRESSFSTEVLAAYFFLRLNHFANREPLVAPVFFEEPVLPADFDRFEGFCSISFPSSVAMARSTTFSIDSLIFFLTFFFLSGSFPFALFAFRVVLPSRRGGNSNSILFGDVCSSSLSSFGDVCGDFDDFAFGVFTRAVFAFPGDMLQE